MLLFYWKSLYFQKTGTGKGRLSVCSSAWGYFTSI